MKHLFDDILRDDKIQERKELFSKYLMTIIFCVSMFIFVSLLSMISLCIDFADSFSDFFNNVSYLINLLI